VTARGARSAGAARSQSALPRLAVLGASTPFTVGLFEALASRLDEIESAHLVLYGRDASRLELNAAYAKHLLDTHGWRVTWTTDLAQALDGAALVLHQIRYGGLEQRAAEERLAQEVGVPADETIGPAALHAAICLAQPLQRLAIELERSCRSAVVLNLTNPLGCSTAILQRGTGCRVVGLCELPRATMLRACAVLGLPGEEVEWAYTGLNHRGFVHRLVHGGRDHLPDLPQRLGDGEIGGITAAEIDGLEALPLKYFALLRPHHRAPTSSRAEVLGEIRARIVDEMQACPGVSPPSLQLRDPTWYRDAVAPMLVALGGSVAREVVVNRACADGIVREVQADVSRHGIVPRRVPAPPQAVAGWMVRFEAHERSVVECALSPSTASVGTAVRLDPLIPSERVTHCVASLQTLLNEHAATDAASGG
jgi:6-phospho-beta-glucosidase